MPLIMLPLYLPLLSTQPQPANIPKALGNSREGHKACSRSDRPAAIPAASIHKHGSCHTLKHSFVTHLLGDGWKRLDSEWRSRRSL